MGKEGSKGLTTQGEHIASLICLNSFSCASSHWKATPFFKSARILGDMCARSGAKWASWFTSPMNDRTPVKSVGAGKHFIAATLSGSADTPSLDTTNPANLMRDPYSIFFRLIRMPASRHLSSTSMTLSRRVAMDSAWMSKSSTIFSKYGSPTRAPSVHWQNTSPALERPMGAQRYLYRPEGSRNVVR